MTKAEIIERIATGTGLTKIETEAVVNGFISTVMKEVREGGCVEIRGFGSFRVKCRASRSARNPRTNEEIELEERFVPNFKPSREFRESVNESWKSRLKQEKIDLP